MSALGLFEKLPREIRDCIYGHVVREYDNVWGDPEFRLEGLLTTCPLILSNKDVRKDVLESWVSQGTFTVKSRYSNGFSQFVRELKHNRVDIATHMGGFRTSWSLFRSRMMTKGGTLEVAMKRSFEHCCQTHKELYKTHMIRKERLLIQVPYCVVTQYCLDDHARLDSLALEVIYIDIRMGNREASLKELQSAYKEVKLDPEHEAWLKRWKSKVELSPQSRRGSIDGGPDEMLEDHTALIEDMMRCWYR